MLPGWGDRISLAGPDAGEGARATQARIAQGQITQDQITQNMKGSQSAARQRPFRVKLRGMVLTLLRLPNGRQVRAGLNMLSTSGGLIHLEKPLDEKIVVDMLFHVDHATIRARGQMLFPMWVTQGWLQPFRFVNLPEASRQGLESNLKSFLERMQKGGAAASGM